MQSDRPVPTPVRAATWTAACLALLAACGGEDVAPAGTSRTAGGPAPAGASGGPAAATAAARTPGGAPAAPAAPARPANAPKPHPMFGEPLIVDGQVIPFEAIRRHLATGVYGQPIIESRRLEIYIEQELKRRADLGEDVSEFQVSAAEVEEEVEGLKEQLEAEYPGGEVTLDHAFPQLKPEKNTSAFRNRIENTKLFEKVFLPDNPYEMPPVTVAALSGTEGVNFLENLKQNWDERQKASAAPPAPVPPPAPETVDDGTPAEGEPATQEAAAQAEDGHEGHDHAAGEGEAPPSDAPAGADTSPEAVAAGDAFMKRLLQSMLLQYLEKNTLIEYPDEDIPADLVLRVEGVGITVDEVWQEIKGLISPRDVENSKKWLVTVTLAKQALEEAGSWLSDEEYAQVYAEVHDPYKDSPFSLERVALTYRKFPSLADYRTYFRIYSSYKKMVADELTDETLQGQLERLNNLLGGEIDCDILLVSAYDFQKGEWKENGWEDAAERAEKIARELAGGKLWDEMIEKYSEFYDLPVAKSQEGQPPAPNTFRHDKGRYKAVKRNELMRRLEESDYSVFLDSTSLSDWIFYYMKAGEYGNPMPGPYGYYIPLVKSRILRARPANLANETHRSLAEQDYLQQHLNHFLYNLKQEADIYGI